MPVFYGGWLFTSLFGLLPIGWFALEARRGRCPPVFPLLAALGRAALNLFVDPEPRAFEHSLGLSVYRWIFDHVPSAGGVRVLRRADLLLQLVLGTGAAITLSYVERRQGGRWVLSACLLVAMIEGVPWRLGAQPIETTCSDHSLLTAASEGARVVRIAAHELQEHETRMRERHMATLCQLSEPGGMLSLAAAPGDRLRPASSWTTCSCCRIRRPFQPCGWRAFTMWSSVTQTSPGRRRDSISSLQ